MENVSPTARTPISSLEPSQNLELPVGSVASGNALNDIECLSPDDALQRLSGAADGLTARQVDERLVWVGRNRIAQQAHYTIIDELVRRSSNPLNLLACDRVLGRGRSAGRHRDRREVVWSFCSASSRSIDPASRPIYDGTLLTRAVAFPLEATEQLTGDTPWKPQRFENG